MCTHSFSNQTCTLSCIDGYFNQISATCGVTGIWSIIGECKPVSCPDDLTIANTDTTDCQEHNLFNESCSLKCDQHYDGTISATCSSSATWIIGGSSCVTKPIIKMTEQTLAYSEAASFTPIHIDSLLIITNLADDYLVNATVFISAGFDSGSDIFF